MGSGSSFCVGCLLVSAVVLFLCPDAQLGIGYILGLFACSVLLKPGGFYLGVDNSLGVFILWVPTVQLCIVLRLCVLHRSISLIFVTTLVSDEDEKKQEEEKQEE